MYQFHYISNGSGNNFSLAYDNIYVSTLLTRHDNKMEILQSNFDVINYVRYNYFLTKNGSPEFIPRLLVEFVLPDL